MSQLLKEEKDTFMDDIAEIREGAENGDLNCQTAYGKCLLFGWGVEQDDAKAYEVLNKAAKGGDEIAKMYVGHCLLYGIGAEKDERKGYELLDGALNFNYPDEGESQSQAEQSDFSKDDMCQLFLDLGDALENSLGVYRNYRVAVYYFNMLASWGEPIGAERKANYKKTLFGWKKQK